MQRTRLAALLSCLVILTALQTSQAQGYPGWSDSVYVFINTTATGRSINDGRPVLSTDVTNFPLLVRLNTATPNFGTSYASVKAGGADLRFSNAAGAALPFQIERWGADSAEVWVLVDSIYANSTVQYIIMYWGNAGAASASNGPAVFGAGYQGVWHMAANFNDASAQARNGVSHVTSTGRRGCIGQGQEFVEATDDWVGLATQSGVTTAFTVSCWAYLDTLLFTGGPQINVLNSFGWLGSTGYGVMLFSGQLVAQYASMGWDNSVGAIGAKVWTQVAVTLSGGTVNKYSNGRRIGQSTGAVINPAIDLQTIGHPIADSLNNYHWYLDEVRELNVSTDSARVALSYEAERRESKLLLVGGLLCQDPRILAEPVDDTVNAGEAAFFSVAAAGTNLQYQWYKGIRPILGETQASLSYPTVAATADSNLSFFCSIGGDCGASLQSRTVHLKVWPVGVLGDGRGRRVAAQGIAAFAVYDVSGRLVASPAMRGAELPAGVRFVRMKTAAGESVRRDVAVR
jgi:hypothetical protein